jgi:5-methylcytosine-specific restriction endonuclease McrA
MKPKAAGFGVACGPVVFNASTLLLTPWYTAHKIITWQKAVTMLFGGDVEVVQEYDETIRSPSVSMQMPAVVRLKRALGSVKRGVKFSRVNVLVRDGFRCQYCGEKKRVGELNYDHVIPRARGGKTVWENIVAACYPCNGKKGGRTPEQAGMRLLSQPSKPKTLPLLGPILDERRMNPAWASWVQIGRGPSGARSVA